MSTPLLILEWTQFVYFLLTGLWPVVHMRSFVAVTGPKADLWLVRTVGLLITAIALPIGLSALRQEPSLEVFVLAVASAGFLLIVDVTYVATRTIAPIYLADAAAELAIVIAWFVFYPMR